MAILSAMRIFRHWCPHAFLVTLLLNISGCDATTEPSCSVFGVYKPIESALCSGSPDQMREAFAITDPAHLRTTAVALKAVWEGRGDVGISLPMERLESTASKLAYAPVLAQSMRDGLVDGDLQPIRDFAARTASASVDGSLEQLQVIDLLGIADTHEAIPYLAEVVRRTSSHTATHKRSIRALGQICDPSAIEELDRIRVNYSGRDETLQAVTLAIEERRKLDDSWCRR